MDSLVRVIVNEPQFRQLLIHQLAQAVSREADQICINKTSQFREGSVESLMSFCFSDAYKDLSNTATLILSVLGACVARSTDQLIEDEQNHIVTATACLLKSKHPQMSSLPYLLSTALYHGGVKKHTKG